MLRNDQRGLIMGLIITIVFIVIIFLVSTNTFLSSNQELVEDTEPNIINQAKDGVNSVNEAGERANSILQGITGN